ncbi:hypothetical protein [Caldanaerobacter subterraneus]|uniref:Uncharacterized protein n=1 Tax=Caldanaerobacter subterraneus TaxID=911092 RepID=A0A7Y2L6V4_9THEO|nr:hypothetical protein [Caldanaerobacter subterraneus]NNG66869.1 hypothetical protein [Caldanaerobacter subterraneus]
MGASSMSFFESFKLIAPFLVSLTIFAVLSILAFLKASNVRKQNTSYIKMSNDLLNEIEAVKKALEKIEKLLKEVD